MLVSGDSHKRDERAHKAPRFAGLELTDYVIYILGKPSYQPELISVLANEPDAIYLDGGEESGIRVIKEATAGGFEGEWLFAADLAVQEVLAAAGKDIHYEGASGPLVFNESGTVSESYTIQKAEGGKWVDVEFYPASRFAWGLKADRDELPQVCSPGAVSFPVCID
jgi:ABC-type branched-subunit amino acid transport system substrate-binding protein